MPPKDVEALPAKTAATSDGGSVAQVSEAQVGRDHLADVVPPHPSYEGYHRFDPAATWTAAEERALVRRTDARLLAWLCVMFFALQLDRGNLANATADDLLADLGLTTDDYNNGTTIQLLAFLAAEFPVQLLVKRYGFRRILPTMMMMWGIVSWAQAWMTDRTGFYLTRAFIGLCEGGFIPGTILFATYFYTSKELSVRLAVFWSSLNVARVISALLAAGILKMRGIHGKPGWFWLFLLEGLLTCVIAIIVSLLSSMEGDSTGLTTPQTTIVLLVPPLVPRRHQGPSLAQVVVHGAGRSHHGQRESSPPPPGEPKFLFFSGSRTPRASLAFPCLFFFCLANLEIPQQQRILRDDPAKGLTAIQEPASWKDVRETWKDPSMFGLYFVGLVAYIPATPVSGYLTLTLKRLGYSTFDSNVLTIPAAVLQILTMLALAWSSDRARERSWHAFFGEFWILPLLAAAVAMPDGGREWGRFSLVTLISGYPYFHPIVAAWISENSFSVKKRAITAATYNVIVQVGSLVGSQIYRAWDSPYYHVGNSVLLALCALSLVAILAQRQWLIRLNRNKERRWQAMSAEERVAYQNDAEAREKDGNRRLDFRFVY